MAKLQQQEKWSDMNSFQIPDIKKMEGSSKNPPTPFQKDTAFVNLQFLAENIWSRLNDTTQISEIYNYYYFELVLKSSLKSISLPV